ncbi:unnamed protein product [Xylocopa violacea]|uniref:Transmembrane protein n=1 Tax=Xylocopa violacea TaxID=135666 RepID=A0ABP1N2K9_XYLVO
MGSSGVPRDRQFCAPWNGQSASSSPAVRERGIFAHRSAFALQSGTFRHHRPPILPPLVTLCRWYSHRVHFRSVCSSFFARTVPFSRRLFFFFRFRFFFFFYSPRTTKPASFSSRTCFGTTYKTIPPRKSTRLGLGIRKCVSYHSLPRMSACERIAECLVTC